MPKHSIKLVVLDYYMSPPIPGLDVTYSEFRSSTVSQVPVLRCFGSTENGKKICLHIHGVFPYLYIPYDGRSKPEDLMYKLASAIDKTINVQFNQANSLAQHVYKISLVSGIPMYGFHVKTHQFFKIYLYNPNLVSRVGSLLLNRSILGQAFQPHEIHLNYTLQFMIDFNLHGMSDISVSEMKFRYNPANAESGDVDGEEFLPRTVEKSSVCELEGDVLAENILNRDEVLSGNLAVNPGIAALWEDERQRKRDKGLTSQLGDFLELKRVNVPPTKTHLMFHQALKERLASTSVDKDVVKENPDASIYPAETPSDATLPNASLLDIRRSSLDMSLDDTMFFNETLTQNDPTLDDDALNFLQILEQLADEKAEVEEQEELQEEDEDELDLSMPLGSVTTPVKSAPQLEEEDLDSTLIPQIDGMHEDDDTERGRFKRSSRSMPSLRDSNCTVDKLKLRAYVKLERLDISKYLELNNSSDVKKKSVKSITVNEALGKLKWRIKMMQSSNRVARLGRVFKRKVGDLKKWKSPKFRVIRGPPHLTNGAEPGERINGSLINLYANCDGAFDTSSSEEDGKFLKMKHAKKTARSTPYPPLKITTSSQASSSSQDVTKGIAEKLEPVSDFHIESAFIRTSKETAPYKRQLFSTSEASSSPLNRTTTQEFLSCAYTSNSNFSSTLQLSSQTLINHSSSDSDLFSGDEAHDLAISEKYDKTINLTAKPGCSTILTSSSATSSDMPAAQVLQKKTQTVLKAPTRARVEATLGEYKIPQVRQLEPFYSRPDDYAGSVEVGHKTLRVPSKTTTHLPEFDSMVNALEEFRKRFVENVACLKWNSNNVRSLKLAHSSNKSVIICPVKKAPSVAEVQKWTGQPTELEPTPKEQSTKVLHIPTSPEGAEAGSDVELSLSPDWPKLTQQDKSCQISGVTPNNTYGFDRSVQDMQAVRAVSHHLGLTTMVMELHVRTRADLHPDPQLDQVCAIFYSIREEHGSCRGVIAVNCLPVELGVSRPDFLDGLTTECDILLVSDEEALFNNLVDLIGQKNPDILAGYEIEMLSWGFLIERASVLSINLTSLLSRSQLHKFGKSTLNSQEFETNIIGRIVLNVWRSMRHEVALQSYTFESVVYHILHRRLASYPFKELTFWWDHRSNLYRHRVVSYYLRRVDVVLELFEKLDFLNRTSELASLFGIQFYEVLSRGSQFRVESMMLRLAKPLNFVPVSPDTRQRAHMRAPEFIPLVMEPESKLYTDPIIVLDFQSLYPSMMIAYNYCFTTCVGRIGNLGSNHPFEFGATQLKVPRKLVRKLCERDLLSYSPCGVAFVKQKVREGILPRMLKEVLDTRLMVKSSMKENKGNETLQKVLHNRQLGLKLIANVTYGYTAANFSGRMCCVEVGDSVVSKGRETLQRAIALVENNREWDVKVVYGDTDSLFILVPGRTKEVAFEIGKKIAEAVTADNPDPVKLKLEKVYQPCILQTKKRYVGLMYESPEQKQPVYEAKGIETVRRDGCPAVSKMLQKCLMILFNTKDVSLIKKYVVKQFSKIQAGRASIQDLTFAKEYRGSGGYRPGACVPALELARKWSSVDKRSEPRRSERVPYVIVHGHPGLPLIRLVRSPRDLLADSSLRPNALYYITKVIIPPLNRCLNLIGADALLWFNQMPRKNTHYLPNSSPIVKSTISQYFVSKLCAACAEPCMEGLCLRCSKKPQESAVVLHEKLRGWEESYQNTMLICQSCTGNLDQVSCASLDCPVLYRRTQTHNDLLQANYVRDLVDTFPVFLESNYFDTG